MYCRYVKKSMNFVFLRLTKDCFNLSSYDCRLTISVVCFCVSKENDESHLLSRCIFIASIFLFFNFVQICLFVFFKCHNHGLLTWQWMIKYPVDSIYANQTKCSLDRIGLSVFNKWWKMKRCTEAKCKNVNLMCGLFMVSENNTSRLGIALWINYIKTAEEHLLLIWHQNFSSIQKYNFGFKLWFCFLRLET